ncbi:hypothetical protein LguiB_026770 [Lonicera macranthoides]
MCSCLYMFQVPPPPPPPSHKNSIFHFKNTTLSIQHAVHKKNNPEKNDRKNCFTYFRRARERLQRELHPTTHKSGNMKFLVVHVKRMKRPKWSMVEAYMQRTIVRAVNVNLRSSLSQLSLFLLSQIPNNCHPHAFETAQIQALSAPSSALILYSPLESYEVSQADQASGEFAPGISDLKDVPGISVFINVLLNTAALRLRRLLVTPSIGVYVVMPSKIWGLRQEPVAAHLSLHGVNNFVDGIFLTPYNIPTISGAKNDGHNLLFVLVLHHVSGILDRAVEAEDNNHGNKNDKEEAIMTHE